MKLSHPSSTQVARSTRGSVRCRATVPTSVATDRIKLGGSGLECSSLGVGAWSWGDRSGYWGYSKGEYDKSVNQGCYNATVDAGIDFIDTAEVYGFGLSEEFIRDFIADGKRAGRPTPLICTKFAPLPWRQTPDSVVDALKKSSERLGQAPDLYLQHWPGFFFNTFSNDAYLEGFIRAKQQGLVKAIGVSNFRPDRIRKWARRCREEGISLACNQVNYSLIYRGPETSGVLETLREEGCTLMAYSPLGQGLLTGKYRPGGAKVDGPRKLVFSDRTIERLQPLLSLMEAISKEREGKTLTQISLNWLMCQEGVFPIPGAKSEKQLVEIAGALGWRLSEGEVRELDAVAKKALRDGELFQGAPFEKW